MATYTSHVNKEEGDEVQGLFGVLSRKGSCLQDLFLGTFGLQHRGQVYCGLSTTNGDSIRIRTHRNLVVPAFENDLEGMEGFAGIGVTSSIDRQPMKFYSRLGEFVIGMDGYIQNSDILKKELFDRGHVFVTNQDVELIATMIAEKSSLEDGISLVIDKIEGPCNILVLTHDSIYASKDRYGFKPLVIGESDSGYAVTSGTCAFNNGMGYEYSRDISPGEVIQISKEGVNSLPYSKRSERSKKCSFEWIYFAEPDSVIDKIPVARVRHNLGRRLAQRDGEDFCFDPKNTVVGPVPNSGIVHAEGYHLESYIPNVELFKPPKYILRTYNLPLDERKRQKSRKLSPIKENIEGKIIVLVDDSIRAGITIRGIIKMLFECGALEVHVRIACPNSKRYCPYSNPPLEEEEFLAATKSEEEIGQIIGATSLRFQNLDEVPGLIGLPKESLCLDCFIHE